MKKVVYNTCHGGFSMSKLATMWLAAKGVDEAVEFLASSESDGTNTWQHYCFYPASLERHAAVLVECVETLGRDANGDMSNLEIKEVPGDLYRIEEYDGYESVICPEDITWVSVNAPDVKPLQTRGRT